MKKHSTLRMKKHKKSKPRSRKWRVAYSIEDPQTSSFIDIEEKATGKDSAAVITTIKTRPNLYIIRAVREEEP